ncbi:hypothetical protein, partial [Sphingobacterium allocomposti]|uniref:hypothetical protein n=1 Tax=Sphingobacterium allocomposti TaxID=415956 RepID=UPI001B86B8AF
QSRWYCRNRWESRSVPNFTGKPLQETARGFFMLRDVRWETSDVGPLSDIPNPTAPFDRSAYSNPAT